MKLVKMLDGLESTVRVKCVETSYTVYVDGTQRLNTTITSMADHGTIALAGVQPKFTNVKVGYDNSADGDIADTGDDPVVSDTFGATSVTLNADNSDGTDDP